MASFEPSYMTFPLADDGEGFLQFEAALPALKRLIGSADVVAAGPGLGQSNEIQALVRWLLETCE